MKTTASKNQIFAKTWRLACLAVLTGLVGVACERDGNGSTKGDDETISLKMVSGASQGKRVKSIDFRDDAKLSKREKLTYVATILPPEEFADCNWSATSVAVDPNNRLGGNRNIVYITWHSNRQAENKATAWGGAIDVLNVLPGKTPAITSYVGKQGKSEVKFNHVLVNDGVMFVSGTSWKNGGTIARIPLNTTNGELVGIGKVECIGFPGSSVNAVAPRNNGRMIAVSGYKGTYAEFAPDIEAKPYDYEHQVNDNVIEPATEGGIVNNFGGKYAISQGDRTYILYCGEGTGILEEVGSGQKIEIGKELTSNTKMAETYNPVTGEWDLSDSTAASNYYGKHTVAIYNNKFAYVACGTSGLAVVDLENNAPIAEEALNNTLVTGLCIDDDKLYAATVMGLRIYTIQPDGHLELFAFEVETYDEVHTGRPTSDVAATTGTTARHSANYVAVDHNTGYIYIAYGQSGVRIYQIEKGVDMGGTVLWYPDNIDGYYAWGEIFCATDPAGFELERNGVTYRNDKSYYSRLGRNKIFKDHIDFNGYRFFNGTKKLTKYTWKHELGPDGEPVSEDGRTVLDLEDDVAYVRLGAGWRMPTKEEWEELLAVESHEVVTRDGKTGLLFKSDNGNELFLPQTGYYGWSSRYATSGNPSAGITFKDSCYYWTASLSTRVVPNSVKTDPEYGKLLPGGECQGNIGHGKTENFWNDECKAVCLVIPLGIKEPYMHIHDRCCGMTIRPVKDK